MPDQGPSKFEAIRQGAKELFSSAADYVEGKAAVGLIALTAFAGGGVGVANQLSTESASASPVPEATASDLQQDCVNAALRKPKVAYPNLGYAYMIYPGDRRRQTIESYAKFQATSGACLPVVTKEAPTVVFKVQNPNNHKKSAKTKPLGLTVNDSNGDRPMQPDEGGIAGISLSANELKNKSLLYRCTPGKGITHAQAVYRLEVDSAVDGHVLGRRSYTMPVKVHPVSGVVLGGGVEKAC